MSTITTRIVTRTGSRISAWGIGALVLSLATSLYLCHSVHAAAVTTTPPTAMSQTVLPPQPLAFEPSARSNASSPREFVARGSDYAVRIDPAGVLFRSHHGSAGNVAAASDNAGDIAMRLENGNTAATGHGLDLLERHTRYYVGNHPAQWRPDVPNYGRVEYRDVYPGVDVVYYGAEGRMEFDFMVAAGADPGRIRLTFAGTTGLRVDAAGNLVLSTGHGELRFAKPVAYQARDDHETINKNAARVAVNADFEVIAPATVAFTLGDYDPARPLVIDPMIQYASYLGGNGSDVGRTLARDSSGNRYIAGSTLSDDFPPGDHVLPVVNPPAKADAYVTKLDPAGTPIYTTFIGGFGTDSAVAIAVDAAGKAYITGDTDSGGLPVSPITPLQPLYGGEQDAFVARLGSDGTLEYISYLGGSALDTALAITLDASGNIYVGGSTLSNDFPPMTEPPADPLNPVCALQCARTQEQPGSAVTGDGFIVKISADFSSYVYASYLGGNEAENVWSIAVDDSGQAYLGGTTNSQNFPTASVSSTPYQQFFGGGAADGFIAKLNAQGDTLLYSTYLGGGGFDRVLGLAIDADGNAYVTGATNSNTTTNQPAFPTRFSLMPFGGGPFDVFVTKFNPAGDDLIYSTYLGGDGSDESAAIKLDDQDDAIVAGTTDSSNFTLVQALQLQQLGTSDGFIAKIVEVKDLSGDTASLTLPFSTYLGGTGADSVNAVAVNGTVIDVVGSSDSTDLPVVTPFQGANAGGQDAFFISLNSDPGITVDLGVTVNTSPIPVPQNSTLIYDVIISNLGPIDATGVTLMSTLINAVFSTASGADCDVSNGGSTAVCHVGDIPAGGMSTVEIKASPIDIAQAVNTASLVRANQTDSAAQNNLDTITTTIVDNSGDKAGSAWVLIFLGLCGLALRQLSGK
jgi:Domain of unknown function DUF11/Beta-propeller repeat